MILLVTDDAVIPGFIRRPLEPLGEKIMVASSLDACRSAIASAKPDTIIVPRRFPEGKLAAVLPSLKLDECERRPTIIAMELASESAQSALTIPGVDGVLQIPFSDSDLLEILRVRTRSEKRILLVDDSPMIHSHTRPVLEEAGYEVISAMDGQEGLDKVHEFRPDLVVTDVEMPRMDGYQLCKAIKDAADSAHLPVIIASSLGEASDLERGFDAGADDYLVKPVVPVELLTRAKMLLAESMPASREHILVVDDSPAQRHYVADCLARQGFQITTAENGLIGLQKALENLPALVVSDYEMPEMSGFELVHALRSRPETRNVPVIMLTARESKRDMAQMRAAGASAYLVKPFAQDKCIATVERTLAEKRLMDYKIASSVYISQGAMAAAEDRALRGELSSLRAEEQDMAVLFSDLAGFTSMSLTMQPREVIELLNDYFDLMCPIVLQNRGDIDKFIGDAIMAVFPILPGEAPPAYRATRAAMDMQKMMPSFNDGRSQQLAMRIGINTGPVVRGDLGAKVVRRDFTVIGDTVNRANRYEMNCPIGGVLISESTRAIVGELAEVIEHPGLSLKGVDRPATGFEVVKLEDWKEESS